MFFYLATFLSVFLIEIFLLSSVILWHHSLIWIILSLAVFKLTKSEKLKVVATNVSIIFSLVLLIEVAFIIHNKMQGAVETKEVGGYEQNSWKDYEKIGTKFFGPNSQVNVKKYYGDELKSDVTYGFDKYSLRVTSENEPPSSVDKSILFFGCSFAFGEGLNDNETFPFWLIKDAGGKYAGRNFAFHGYGTQQMLALLEDRKFVDEAVGKTKVKYAFYEMIPDHIKRTSGYYTTMHWGLAFPRYELRDGEAKYTGNFRDYYEKTHPMSFADKVLVKYLHDLGGSRSALVDYLRSKTSLATRLKGYKMNTDKQDSELLVRVVEKSANILSKNYGAKFYTIIWDNSDKEDVDYIKTRFDQIGIKYFLVSEIIKDLDSSKKEKYFLDDGHPNGVADKMIAEFISNKVLK
jgi:hypothetical protein